MRSISCILISFVMYYMALYTNMTKLTLRGALVCLSYCMLVASIILMIIGS
jgi:uncharacterized membrane protein (GlpM family)|nr:MAG TPA: hypothetical protein [Caudoviricetes sp.]